METIIPSLNGRVYVDLPEGNYDVGIATKTIRCEGKPLSIHTGPTSWDVYGKGGRRLPEVGLNHGMWI